MLKLFVAATALILTSSFTSSAYANMSEYQLDQGRQTMVALTKDASTSDWLVLLPGSGCNQVPTFRVFDALLKTRAFNTMIISKVGSEEKEDDCHKDDFQRSSLRPQRIKDAQTIMHDLIPTSGRIFLIGYSEGGYIAPDVAVADSRVKAFLSYSGNTLSWMTEEVMWLPPGQKRDELQTFFDTKVRGNNSFTEMYEDWSYAYLNSYDTHQAYDMMMKLQIPVLWLNGDQDDVLWIQGARMEAMDLINKQHKSNIEYHFIKGAGHDLKCAKTAPTCDSDALATEVYGYVRNFMAAHF